MMSRKRREGEWPVPMDLAWNCTGKKGQWHKDLAGIPPMARGDVLAYLLGKRDWTAVKQA